MKLHKDDLLDELRYYRANQSHAQNPYQAGYFAGLDAAEHVINVVRPPWQRRWHRIQEKFGRGPLCR